MDRILREQRRFDCWLSLFVVLVAAVCGTLGWMAGTAPPRPIVVHVGWSTEK